MSALFDHIKELCLTRVDFVNNDAEAVVRSTTGTVLDLQEASTQFDTLADGDVDQLAIGGALVDLADLVQASGLIPAQRDRLDVIVDTLLKTGTPDQKEGAKNLFSKTLAFLLSVKAENEYFDNLLQTPPPTGN